MNRKEIAQIRRRLNLEKCAATRIRGCYVSTERQVVSMFDQLPSRMPEEELEKYLSIFKKVLSGTQDKNLIGVEFSTEQVREGEEHALLTALRESALEDEAAVEEFYGKVIESLCMEDNYLILLMHDAYDVPAFTSDGEKLEDSTEVFHYILCAVCPVRQTKPALSYCGADSAFHPRELDWVVNAPDVGFMFPLFEDRGPNIYGSLYYVRDIEEAHDELIEAIFAAGRPMPAAEQKETFRAILEEALAEECSYDVVQAVHEQIGERIQAQKADKEAEPVRLTRNEVTDMLRVSGVPEERVEAFEAQYDEHFGAGTDVSAVNIVETKKISVCTPNVSIKVDPSFGHLIETRVIDGRKYILIHAEEGVEVNGVNISINDDSSMISDAAQCPF